MGLSTLDSPGCQDSNLLPRKIEKWSDIVSQINIDISKPINYVTPSQIKRITNEDARLMAKIDRLENLPEVFRENNLFLLPVSRKEYAIVKEDIIGWR